MRQLTDHDVIDEMESLGGSFVKALGEAWRRADFENAAKLKAAFPEYWKEYSRLAAVRLEREEKGKVQS